MPLWSNARAQWHYRMAHLLLRLHRDEAAADAYGRVLRIRPDDREAQFHRAWCLLHVPARRAEGITAFQDLLRASPSAAGFFLMGCGLQLESRHAEAVDAFREAARLESPAPADLHYNHAISLTALRRVEEAADAYQNAAHLNPSDGEAWGHLGAAFADLGRWKDAAPCQERALRLAPSLTHGLNLGSTLYELKRLDDAERVLRDAVARDPRSTEAKELLAMVLAGQDRYDEAIAMARAACQSNADAPSSRATLAGVLAEAGCLEEALRVAASAAEAAPTDTRVHGALATVYIKMNDGRSALAAFERMAACLVPETDRLPSSPWVSCIAGRGVALSLLSRHDEAMDAFNEVRHTDPAFFERWPELAPHYQLSVRESARQREPVIPSITRSNP